MVPDFQRLISVEGWSLLDRFNLLKPLVVPPGLLEASVEVEQQDRFRKGATGLPSRCSSLYACWRQHRLFPLK